MKNHLTLGSAALLALVSSADVIAQHLLISEVVLAPQAGEYIEVLNLSPLPVDLTNYYLADSAGYWHVPIGAVAPNSSDFMVKFPDGSSIAPNQAITISVTTVSSGFLTTYGEDPDYIVPSGIEAPPRPAGTPPLMVQAFFGSIGIGHGLTDAGE